MSEIVSSTEGAPRHEVGQRVGGLTEDFIDEIQQFGHCTVNNTTVTHQSQCLDSICN